jgi:hypothetical protein
LTAIQASYARADFEGSGNQGKYTALNWNFTPGTGEWKWLPGYDYPVLQWQTTPPDYEFTETLPE